jgi:hypothetical protein
MESESEAFARDEWWAARRWPYNRALIIAGIVAFVCYVVVAGTLIARIDPGVEITIFTTAFQGFGYLVAMGIANLCYFLGPLSERIIRPRDPVHFRHIAYRLGFWFSVLLPFRIPVLLSYLAVFHPEQFNHDEFGP